jgi:hypothetical protein
VVSISRIGLRDTVGVDDLVSHHGGRLTLVGRKNARDSADRCMADVEPCEYPPARVPKGIDMTLRSKALPLLTLLMLGATTVAAAADDPCAGFKWNVTEERALFAKTAETAVAAHDAASAPVVKADKLYELALSPQDGVKFVLPPGKKSLPDGAFAGLVRLQVPTAGLYRISLDQGLWIDVVGHHQMIDSTDFAGATGCTAPRKIVQFILPAGKDLVLQMSAAAKDHVRVTLTPAPAPAH